MLGKEAKYQLIGMYFIDTYKTKHTAKRKCKQLSGFHPIRVAYKLYGDTLKLVSYNQEDCSGMQIDMIHSDFIGYDI